MENKKWIIYKHENLINGKVYIGQTCTNIKQRSWNGEGYKECPYFWKAICKYGWDNFSHEILHDNIKTQDEANKLEIKYIEKYKSTNPEYGYNISLGGSNEEHNNVPVYQYSLSGEFIDGYSSHIEAENKTGIGRMAIAAASRGERMSASGYIWSREKADKIEPHLFNTKSCKVYQYDLSGKYITEYENAHEAGKQFGYYASHRIIQCCNKERNKFKNYQWRYYYSEKIDPIESSNGESKIVYQYDLDGNYITKYTSCIEAAKIFNVSKTAIASCCRGVCKTVKNYIWSYKYANNYYNLI